MIRKAEREYTKQETDRLLDPVIKKWFYSKFEAYAPPQKYAVREIHQGRNVLISSPTGTGKTLSGFLSVINELFILARNNMLEDRVYCVYVSPLKALSNDIEKNLKEPLKDIYMLARDEKIRLPRIRVGKRTGDTSPSERAKQLKKPPHIFITTPESLAIMINSPRLVEKLREVRWLIVDEIHALADNKRGTHLSLTVERLLEDRDEQTTRIGLSATIHPLETVAEFLAGYREEKPRDCLVVDVSYAKKRDIRVMSPLKDIVYASAEEIHESLYRRLDQLISSHRTSLIFTNTRAGTESVVHFLKEKFGDKYKGRVEAHHGSMSKKLRFDVENRLKKGELKAVVTSTSLELGIDIGYIDLVILLGSPKSVTRCLQRIGRSGHKLHDKAKGRVVVLDRDDLVECAVMARAAKNNFLDKVHVPENCLDVLAQHLVGMSLEKRWQIEDALSLIKRSYCYRSLNREDFMSVLRYLAGKHTSLEHRHVYAKLWYDEDKEEFGRKGKLMRMIYYTNIGTIPDESSAKIKTSEGVYLGSVDESFLERLRKGDRFVLGGSVYEFRFARGMTGTVDSAYERLPTIPSWFSEMLPLSFDLGVLIGKFRFEVRQLLKGRKDFAVEWLEKELDISRRTAEAVYSYFREQEKYMGIPTHAEIFVEDYVDEMQRQNFIFHTLFGRRTNDALSRAYAYALSKMKKITVGLSVTDNGFVLTMPSYRRAEARDVVRLVNDQNIEDILKLALEGTEMLKRRFRHVATRSLLVLRSYKGRQKSVGRQKMSSHVLYHVIKKIDPGFPVIKETFREILEDAMDTEGARTVLKNIRENKARFIIMPKRDLPSPFAHNLILAGASDAIMMESKRELLKLLHRQVLERIREAEA